MQKENIKQDEIFAATAAAAAAQVARISKIETGSQKIEACRPSNYMMMMSIESSSTTAWNNYEPLRMEKSRSNHTTAVVFAIVIHLAWRGIAMESGRLSVCENNFAEAHPSLYFSTSLSIYLSNCLPSELIID